MWSVTSTVLTLVLFATYLGIGALAHDTHFSLGWVLASTAFVWAGPAQIILISTLGSGALKGVDFYSNLEVIYWLHRSRRDLVLQSPKNNRSTRGTFSLRSPQRPNPIGTSIVKLVGVEDNTVFVRGLDCLDETPLLDLKPDRCEFTPSTEQPTGNIDSD